MKTITPKVETGACWQLWLDGKEDLLKVWELPPSPQDSMQRQREIAALAMHPGFYGVANAGVAGEQEARAIISKGWPEGAKLVESLSEKLQPQLMPPKSRRRTRKWAEDGDEISYERLQLGQDAWLSSHRKLRSACGLVEVVAGWGSSCGASIQQLQWSGAAALALTDLLEKADYSVELALVGAMHNGEGASIVRVDLKRMGELVDLEQLAAIAVYPPAWRIYGLAAFQLAPWSSGDYYNSHLHATALSFEPNGMWNYRANVMTVTLPESHNQIQAISCVTQALKQLESLVNPQDDEETGQ